MTTLKCNCTKYNNAYQDTSHIELVETTELLINDSLHVVRGVEM